MKIGPVDSGEWRARPRETKKSQVESGDVKQEPAASEDTVRITDSLRLSLKSASEAVPLLPSADDGQTSSSDETDEASSDEAADDESKKDEAEAEQAKIDEAIQKEQSGFYDRPEVKEQIARRIADDLMG